MNTRFLLPFYLLSITFFSFLHSAPKEEEIVVQLDTEIPLMPLFLGTIESQDSTFSKDYLVSLREVLAFDINYNGATKVLTPQEIQKRSSLQGQSGFDTPCSFEKLRKDDVLYVIKLKTKEKELIAKVISVNGEHSRTIENISLTNDLAQDRRKMHQLADTIHSLLFQKPGIASCKILFTVKKVVNDTIIGEIFEADYDGKNQRQLTHEGALCTHPLYLIPQDESKPNAFCFISYKIGQPKIYYASLKGGAPRRASTIRGNQLTPSISPDSSSIAFACDFTGTSDIFLQPFKKEVGPIGKPYHIFAAKGSAQASPVFSPDGKKIAFVSDKDGSPKIYVMDVPPPGAKLKDIKVQLITKRCRENSAPSWSPDGKKLAYSARNSGIRQIWIYDFETKRERELTQGKGIKENPSWASDSLHLLFNAIHNDHSDLYLVNLNQPQAVKITSTSYDTQFPSWEPKKEAQ